MATRADLLVSDFLCLLVILNAVKDVARWQAKFFAALGMTGGATIWLLLTWLV